MTGEVRSQHCELWYADTTLKKIGNISDIGEFGAMSDDIDVTNLDDLAKQFLTGLGDNGEITLQINLNPTDTVHQDLFAKQGNGNRYSFCLGLSDGTTPPTAPAGVMTPPAAAARTSYVFLASIKSFKQAIKTNDAVRVTVTLRISGAITATWHT